MPAILVHFATKNVALQFVSSTEKDLMTCVVARMNDGRKHATSATDQSTNLDDVAGQDVQTISFQIDIRYYNPKFHV